MNLQLHVNVISPPPDGERVSWPVTQRLGHCRGESTGAALGYPHTVDISVLITVDVQDLSGEGSNVSTSCDDDHAGNLGGSPTRPLLNNASAGVM